jgi:hypothetical protein
MAAGKATGMQMQLTRLARHHGVNPVRGRHIEPLRPAIGATEVCLEGFITRYSADLTRVKFGKYSLAWSRHPFPPLRYRHEGIIGEIHGLEYRPSGLWISCRTGSPQGARAGAFSLAAEIDDFVIRDADDPRSFHAEVTRARLIEVSLVHEPADPAALVQHSYPAHPPHEEFYDASIRWLNAARQMIELTQRRTA